jgi:prevent-host-death family protein
MPIETADTVSATEAKNRFGAILKRVARTGGPVVVERDGRPVAILLSFEAYEQRLRRSLPDSDRLALARSAFGMWAEREDRDAAWLRRGRERWRSDWRSRDGR